MCIETVPNRSSPPAVLLRESYRDEEGRAQKRTLANLSKLPGDVIEWAEGAAEGRHGDRHRPERDADRAGHCRMAMSQRRSACCADSPGPADPEHSEGTRRRGDIAVWWWR